MSIDGILKDAEGQITHGVFLAPLHHLRVERRLVVAEEGDPGTQVGGLVLADRLVDASRGDDRLGGFP